MTPFPLEAAQEIFVSRRLDRDLDPFFLVMARHKNVAYRRVARCDHEPDAQAVVAALRAHLDLETPR